MVVDKPAPRREKTGSPPLGSLHPAKSTKFEERTELSEEREEVGHEMALKPRAIGEAPPGRRCGRPFLFAKPPFFAILR